MTNVKFGVTTKPINSTSRIFYGGSTVSLSCKLKEPCSRQAPVFEVQGLTKLNNYNFAEWENFYYWIDDIIFMTNDIQEVHCHLDPLATFRDDIKDNNYYVVYGDSGHWNDWIDDVRFQPEKQHIYIPSSTGFYPFGGDRGWSHAEIKLRPAVYPLNPDDQHYDHNDGGTVIVTVMETCSEPDLKYVGDHIQPNETWGDMLAAEWKTHQGVNVYAVRYCDFIRICANFSNYFKCLCDLGASGGSSSDLAKEFGQIAAKFWGNISGAGSIMDNLISCVYLPLRYKDVKVYAPTRCAYFAIGGVAMGYETETVDDTVFSCYRFDKPYCIADFKGAVNIPWATDITVDPSNTPSNLVPKYAFLRNSRWFNLQAYTPSGYASVDMQELKGQTDITVWVALDLFKGDWRMRFTETGDANSEVLCSFAGNIGYNITQWFGSGDNPFGQFNEIVNKVGTAMLSSYLKTDMSQATSMISSAKSNRNLSQSDRQSIYDTYSPQITRDELLDGIIHTGTPTGINPGIPASGMCGDITSIYLTTEPMKCYLIGIQYIPFDINNYYNYCGKHGYPVNKWLNLKNDNVTGYVKCSGAYLDYCQGATQANLSTINSYLNNGIVIEE